MTGFEVGTLDPFLLVLAGWSIRWGVLIAALAVWLRAWPPRRAATRHLLCATALTAGLALPFAPSWSAPWPSWPASRLAPARPAFAPARLEPRRQPEPVLARPLIVAPLVRDERRDVVPEARPSIATPRVAERPGIGRPAATVAGPGPWRWGRLSLSAVWLAGALAVSTRLLVGRRILGRLRSTARPMDGAMLARCRSELGVTRRVVLATHPAVGSPVVLGGRSPLILVPEDWDAWPESARRACLLHELAHLARWDDLVKLAAELVRAPFWFHPAVAWLLARLDREAELACDDEAVGLGVSPRALAEVLLDFAAQPRRLDLGRLVTSRHALSFLDRHTVSNRIQRLLEDDMSRALIPASRSRTFGQASLVAALALVIGGARASAVAPDDSKPPESARVRPAPAQSVSVLVKDAEGRPVEGATVVAGIVKGRSGHDATVGRTGADGLARFDRAADPGLWFVAFKEGHSLASRNLFDASGKIPTPLVLPRAAALSGTVVDEKGHPVEGAEFHVQGAHSQGRPPVIHFVPAFASLVKGTPIEGAITARSDAQGNFRLASMPEKAVVSLKTSAPGMATTTLRTSVGSSIARVVLSQEARVAGKVVSNVPGVSVAGLSVKLQGVSEGTSSGSSGDATTDAEGRFSISGLAAGRANVFLDGVPADGPWTFQAAQEIHLKPGATTEATIEVVPGSIVTGKVTSTDGKPIAGVAVVAHGARNPQTGTPPVEATTDDTGAFRLRMGPGNLSITVVGRVVGYATLGNGESTRSVVVPDSGKPLVLSPFLMAPGVTLSGHIVDASGKPLPGARLVGICNQNTCTPLNQPSATADAEGAFHLDTQADGQPIPMNQPVTFQVRLADGREFDASVVPTDKGAVTIKLPTLREGAPRGPEQVAPDEIAGVVVDTQGKPIEGVLAHPYSWVPHIKALTDKAGRFRVKVPEQGKIEIRFTKEGYEPREFLRQPTGQPGWVVVMGNRTYFEGRVLGPNGAPVADAPIRADSGPKRMDGGLMTACWTEGQSGKDGRYRLYVEPGMYEFQVRVPSVGVVRLPGQGIATDEAVSLDLKLGAGINFEARVVDSQDGKPIEGFLLKDWQNPTVAGTSNADGILRIPAMLPGVFTFRMIKAEGYARWWSDACVSEWSRFEKESRFGFQRNLDGLDFDLKPGMAPVTITAEKAATIKGRVLDPDGRPVAGATAAPALTGSGNSLTGDTRFSVETKQDGTFTMTLPASGAIAYNLVAHDGKFQQWRTWANGTLPPFRTAPGQVLENVTLRLTRPATVRGRVLDASGQPVAGREVRASAADKRENRYYDPTTKTKPDGTFELRFIRAGEQHIQVAPFWLYADQAPEGTSRSLTLKEGEIEDGVTLSAGPDR